MGNLSSTVAPPPKLEQIAPDCFRLRVPFYIFFFDVGTHVNFIRLSNGRFLVLSAAVVATNPFHTTAFAQWAEVYPRIESEGRLFGTPRHLRNLPGLKWAGSVEDQSVRDLWKDEVEMRIPAGCEFNNPTPELTNHFNGIVAFHRASKTVICDDAFAVSNPSLLDSFSSCFAFQSQSITFHPSMPNQALYKTPKAARQFYDWVIELTHDWDFDNMASAHGSYMIGGAKEALLDCLEKARKSLSDHSLSCPYTH
ncbi:hypothetical protein BCR33DRAFT_716271 [Rhizoclosmatium globosum]|uniref:Uncharacterized protein n=1 Tax=Rhizoclosmatium globosum TaxID=329046 RepID=A0A1Y2CEY5_9FUNG|nr:hypothetical protein BCR33DRAFT_716271 [Rhizoclosmatium globosum]|eukprot:ORY45623.1 hypothetical protein BCR33DRAFT_716271 [Rhizoclosmatium globosum]